MRILVLPGDGIGPEITAVTMAVLERANETRGLGLEFDHDIVGFDSLARHGSTFRDELAERFTSYEGVILGPNDGARYPPRAQGGLNYSAIVRTRYDLYANLRPARTPPALPGKAGAFDLVIAREVTEGFYADRNMAEGNAELMPDPDMVISLRKVTRRACERIARRAFELAVARAGQGGRGPRVTAVHKANVLKRGDGLFLDAVRTIAREYPGVALDDFHIDAMAALLVRDPSRFDVIVTTNMYGDILSDLASELAGSLGLAAGLLVGDRQAAAQAQHGAAPDIAGQDRANPSSLILSAAMLLEWLGQRHGGGLAEAGAAIRDAVDRVIADPAKRTADLCGPAGTRAFGEAVAAALG